jgi:hypothetical protein
MAVPNSFSLRLILWTVLAAGVLLDGPEDRGLATLYVGGTDATSTKIESVPFLVDFRERRTIISSQSYKCSPDNDCFVDRSVSRDMFYKGLKYSYFAGNVNISFEKTRLDRNTVFNYVTSKDVGTDKHIVGLNRRSDFALSYFYGNKRGLRNFNIKFNKEQVFFYNSPQINLAQAHKFDVYASHDNQENFYLSTELQVLDADGARILTTPIRLCSFSSPELTDSGDVFLSGKKETIDSLRKFFTDYHDKLPDLVVSLKLNSSGSYLNLKEVVTTTPAAEVFSYVYSDTASCDLYFGAKFLEHYNIEFIVLFNEKENAVDLYFSTHKGPVQQIGFGLLIAAAIILVLFFVVVLTTSYSEKKTKLDQERRLSEPIVNETN